MATRFDSSFAHYFARLRGDLDGEIEQFINAFTVNETYFYREDHQLECLAKDLLNRRAGEGQAARAADAASGPFPAQLAKSPIRSRSGSWKTGPRSTPTTSRSLAQTSTPRPWRPPAPASSADARWMRFIGGLLVGEDISSQWAVGARRMILGRYCASPVRAFRRGQPSRIQPDPPSRPVRRYLLPQRADLFRRCIA